MISKIIEYSGLGIFPAALDETRLLEAVQGLVQGPVSGQPPRFVPVPELLGDEEPVELGFTPPLQIDRAPQEHEDLAARLRRIARERERDEDAVGTPA